MRLSIYRNAPQSFDKLQLGMVLQKLPLGRRAHFVAGSNYSGWHPNVFRNLPLIIGVASLATTLLLGSFIWRFGQYREQPISQYGPWVNCDFNYVSMKSSCSLECKEIGKFNSIWNRYSWPWNGKSTCAAGPLNLSFRVTLFSTRRFYTTCNDFLYDW